jgi:NAD-dependent histone deacetylase SIR2
VFVIGTSLVVHPFASLPGFTLPSKPRILLNNDLVDDFDRPNDAYIPGDCDESIWKLCRKLGWHEDLRQLHKKINGISREWDIGFTEPESANEESTETAVEDTVEQLAKELNEELRFDEEEDAELRNVENVVDKADDTVVNDGSLDEQKDESKTAKEEVPKPDATEKL